MTPAGWPEIQNIGAEIEPKLQHNGRWRYLKAPTFFSKSGHHFGRAPVVDADRFNPKRMTVVTFYRG